MSRRGLIPVFVATGIGVINGIWVFRPALKEQQMLKSTDIRKESAYTSMEKETSAEVDQQADATNLQTNRPLFSWYSIMPWAVQDHTKYQQNMNPEAQIQSKESVQHNQTK